MKARHRPDDAVEIPIVYEDANLLVVDKPEGILTVSPRSKGDPSVWSMLRRTLREREPAGPRRRGSEAGVLRGGRAAGGLRRRIGPLAMRGRIGGLAGAPRRSGRGAGEEGPEIFLVHRLDRPASGLMLFAKSERAREGLKAMLAAREIKRTYAAIVIGRPPAAAGEIHSRLVEIEGDKLKVRSLRPGDSPALRRRAREAVTRYRVVGAARGLAALEVELQTGRKHQIRVHLSESGYPVAGDRLYGTGRTSAVRSERLLLHAWKLRFQHPVTRRWLEFVSPPGAPFERAVPGAFRTS